jgi:thioredoxin 1
MSVSEVRVDELFAAHGNGAVVIDVREPHEFAAGHVAGARLVPMRTLPSQVQDLPTDTGLYVICESGARSWQATAFLVRHGITAVNVEGGMSAWRGHGYPVETGAPGIATEPGSRTQAGGTP